MHLQCIVQIFHFPSWHNQLARLLHCACQSPHNKGGYFICQNWKSLEFHWTYRFLGQGTTSWYDVNDSGWSVHDASVHGWTAGRKIGIICNHPAWGSSSIGWSMWLLLTNNWKRCNLNCALITDDWYLMLWASKGPLLLLVNRHQTHLLAAAVGSYLLSSSVQSKSSKILQSFCAAR